MQINILACKKRDKDTTGKFRAVAGVCVNSFAVDRYRTVCGKAESAFRGVM